MGQDQTGVVKPQLTPKQQVKIKGAGPPALLELAIPSAALFQPLQLLQQLQCRQLRRGTLHAGKEKDGIAVRVLIRGPPDRLGRQKRGATHITSVGVAPLQENCRQPRSNPTQRGFRRTVRAAQVGPKPNSKSCFQREGWHCNGADQAVHDPTNRSMP